MILSIVLVSRTLPYAGQTITIWEYMGYGLGCGPIAYGCRRACFYTLNMILKNELVAFLNIYKLTKNNFVSH